MLKTILSAVLLVSAAGAASADTQADRIENRVPLASAEAAHRAAGAHVARVERALRQAERDLRKAQLKIDALTARYNRASRLHHVRLARTLSRQLDLQVARADELEAKRDLALARLNIARTDYVQASEQLLTAARATNRRPQG